jgi:hypothetical protein
MLTNLRVHIAPVGFDEPERIVVPLVHYKADKAFLISHLQDNSVAEERLQKVRESLAEKLPSCEVETKTTHIWDLFSCLETYREIFVTETENHIMVNVSTGSKILAIAGMLSCMLWDAKPYYAKLNYSHQGLAGKNEVLGVDWLPVYSIRKPTIESLKVISVINKYGGTTSKKKLIEKLQAAELRLIPVYGKDASRTAPHSKLRAILNPLVEWSYVKVKSRGRRSDIILTAQGKRALRIFGDLDVESVPAENENFQY